MSEINLVELLKNAGVKPTGQKSDRVAGCKLDVTFNVIDFNNRSTSYEILDYNYEPYPLPERILDLEDYGVYLSELLPCCVAVKEYGVYQVDLDVSFSYHQEYFSGDWDLDVDINSYKIKNVDEQWSDEQWSDENGN